MATKKTASKIKSDLKPTKEVTNLRKSSSNLPALQKNLKTETNKIQFVAQHKKQLIIGALLVAIIAFVYFFKSLFIVALVNGAPITRIDLVKELEKQGGKKTLDGMITNMLILQEAKKKNVSVSKEELDKELKKIEAQVASQGQSLDTLLAMQGFSKSDLLKRIETQKLVEKMVASDIKVSGQEISDYVDKNRAAFPPETNENDLKNQAKEALTQQKLDEKIQAFVSDIQKRAKIDYFLNL